MISSLYLCGTRAQGKHSEAVPLLEGAVAAMKETHGADNESTVTLRRLLKHAQAQVCIVGILFGAYVRFTCHGRSRLRHAEVGVDRRYTSSP